MITRMLSLRLLRANWLNRCCRDGDQSEYAEPVVPPNAHHTLPCLERRVLGSDPEKEEAALSPLQRGGAEERTR